MPAAAELAAGADGRNQEACREAAQRARRPTSELLRMESNYGTNNIRNVNSVHWKRWLDPEQRRPFTSFSEYDTIESKKTPGCFAPNDSRPLLCFAGLWTNCTTARNAKEANVDVYAF